MALYTDMDAVCPEGNCKIDLAKLVDGDWDKVIFMKQQTPLSVLAEIVGW